MTKMKIIGTIIALSVGYLLIFKPFEKIEDINLNDEKNLIPSKKNVDALASKPQKTKTKPKSPNNAEEWNAQELIDTPINSYYDQLQNSVALGNSDAEYLLSKINRKCRKIPEDRLDLEEYFTNRTNMNESLKQSIEDRFQDCLGVPRDQMDGINWKKYVINAARNGNMFAKLEFGKSLPDYSKTDLIAKAEEVVALKKETMNHLIDARNMGSNQALIQLGETYGDGILVERNLIESYAHFMAYNSLNPQGPQFSLDRLSRQMNSNEILTAEERSTYYEKCCN